MIYRIILTRKTTEYKAMYIDAPDPKEAGKEALRLDNQEVGYEPMPGDKMRRRVVSVLEMGASDVPGAGIPDGRNEVQREECTGVEDLSFDG